MPITNSESDKSVISPEEARELMQQVEVKQKPVIEEEDDLMDIE